MHQWSYLPVAGLGGLFFFIPAASSVEVVPDPLEDEPVDEPDPNLELEPAPGLELLLPPAPVELLPVAGLFFFIPAASSVEVPPDMPEDELPVVELFLPVLPIDVEPSDPIELDDIETPNALAVLLSMCPVA